MSYNSRSSRARNFKSASRFALVRFWNYSRDYSLNCTPLGPITITYIFVKHGEMLHDGKAGENSRIAFSNDAEIIFIPPIN